MSIYDRISTKYGRQNWHYCIFHDDGNIESDGGGKSLMYLAPPGKGKSTLMVQAAQFVRSIEGDSKKKYVFDLDVGNPLDSYLVKPETVIWRIREFDNFGALIPANWIKSVPNWNSYIKPVHIFVHEDDNPLFYSIRNNEPISPPNFIAYETYSTAQDLMKKIEWNAVNCVLEPQTYHLSDNLIFALRKHKMDDGDETYDRASLEKKRGRPKKKVDYAAKLVDPAYFWYDLIDIAVKSNNRKHMTIFIDEFHDVAEADCEGDAWKLVSILATKIWPNFRKNNVSVHLSTHQMSFVDYRIARRIEYINWFRGAKISPGLSMINQQALLSQLNMGQLITEETNIQFGIMTFDKINDAPPQVYVHGLQGQNPAITPEQARKLYKVQEDLQMPDYTRLNRVMSSVPDVIEI